MDSHLFQKTVIDKGLVTPEEIESSNQEELAPPLKSHRLRNILIGVSAAAAGLFLFKRTAKAADKILTLEASMKLEKDFTLGEFLISSDMPELKDYQLSEKEFSNVKRLAATLQRLRNDSNSPIYITSGGRPSTAIAKQGRYKGLNFIQILTEKGYKPSAHSQHMDFSAADFTTQDKQKLLTIYNLILQLDSRIPGLVTQGILYIENGVPDFIHLGVKSDIEDFTKVILKANKFLLAQVTVTELPDSGHKRDTKFIPFSGTKLRELLDIA